MPAYWLARCKINDPVEYSKYTDRVAENIKSWKALTASIVLSSLNFPRWGRR